MVAHMLNTIWAEDDTSPLMLDCLLPTGIMVPLSVKRHATIEEIKEEIWSEAGKYPLYSLLKNKDAYVLMCINEMASRVELEDESQRLSEVRPFQPMVKIIEKKGNKADRAKKIIDAQISVLLGKGLHEFDSLKSTEVSDFRKNMRHMTERVVKERDSQAWVHRVMCLYPPDLASSPSLPEQLQAKLINNLLQVVIHIENTEVSYTFRVAIDSLPDDLIQKTLEKRKMTGISLGIKEDFVLKVCGREDYLMGDYPLSQFMYFRNTLAKEQLPKLLLQSKAGVLEGEPPVVPPRQNGSNLQHKLHGPPPPPPPRMSRVLPPKASAKVSGDRPRGTCLWDLTDKYSITVESVSNLTIAQEYSKIQVRAGIYHGSEPMCSVINTKECMLVDGMATWNDSVTFDLELADIPRMARLCFLVQALVDRRTGKRPPTGGVKTKIGRQEVISLAWVNIPIFDYKGVLQRGSHTMYMWSITDDDILSEELLNPLGTVEQNPHTKYAVCLKCVFDKYNQEGPINFPPFDQVLELAAQTISVDSKGAPSGIGNIRHTISSAMMNVDAVNSQKLESLRVMVDRDPLHPLHEQEKELIWMLRYECQYHFPESLPKLLSCVQWNNHKDTAQMYALLQIWQTLTPTQALELLDCQYADKDVRKYAVKCLKDLSDRELCQYLLQLVQVLKYELYLECDLVEFLLNRALNNQRVGHFFFWLLRSEMHVPSVSVRFGLILEAYCRSNLGHLRSLSRQVEALMQMADINKQVHDFRCTKKEGKEKLQAIIQQERHLKALSHMNSVLDPSYKLGAPKVPSCKYMDSKMKPLSLTFENEDRFGDDVVIMYKKGDDLRKDMLTLQIIRIMDYIWQEEGLDLKMNAYQCLSTGQDEGLIDIVTNSDTLANIQKEYPGLKLKSAFNKQCIYEWLKKNNESNGDMERAMEDFTLSCAGYCVATYVLGVADRHSDNIMVRKNGQLFHIDFGHILGHFKTKLGVKRERVPFVLTADFVYVIQRGRENRNKEFDKFREYCTKAFMALRRKSNFLISLFMMMMNTGIDELSSLKDVEYLKETLVPHLSEEEASSHFHSKFQEALKNSWKSSVNNAIHNMAKDNT